MGCQNSYIMQSRSMRRHSQLKMLAKAIRNEQAKLLDSLFLSPNIDTKCFRENAVARYLRLKSIERRLSHMGYLSSNITHTDL